MAKSNERSPQVSIIPIGSRVSGTTVVIPGMYFRKKSKIKNVWLIDRAGIAASGSNYQTVTLQDLAGPTVIASLATSGVAAVANTPLALAYTSTSDSTNSPEIEVAAGTTVHAKTVGTGTAVLTDAVMLIEWYPL